jgi:hypothetical protein
METVQLAPDTLEQPVHELKIESAAGEAVSVIVAPFTTGAVQTPVFPVVQEIPVPSTVPLPDTSVVSA